MKLPKKLRPGFYLDEVIGEKVNQIIDYLSDKEASKGELEHPKCATCKYFGDNCGNHSNPPQQEESRGEKIETPEVVCKSCGAEMVETEHYIGSKKLRSDFNCSKCGLSDLDKTEPQLKEESPKEDEQEWTHDFYELMQTYRHTLITDQVGTSKAYELVKDYIKANFVSKVKIKERINQCGYVQHGRFIDKEDLLESLGLEEL